MVRKQEAQHFNQKRDNFFSSAFAGDVGNSNQNLEEAILIVMFNSMNISITAKLLKNWNFLALLHSSSSDGCQHGSKGFYFDLSKF